jgi:hypothetical protein
MFDENCRRPDVAILDMQMSKVPIISGCELFNQSIQRSGCAQKTKMAHINMELYIKVSSIQ